MGSSSWTNEKFTLSATVVTSSRAALCLGLLILLTTSAFAQIHVPSTRILRAADEPGNWLTYSGNYAGHRHSALTQITPANVGGLKPAWIYQPREAGKWEVTPLVVDGTIYITEKPNVVTALDGRTGRPLWNYKRPMPNDVAGCCGPVNRGVAILGDALYLCTFDCHLVCIDANTGAERWDIVVADYRTGHSMTVAPLVVKDKIIVGIAGGDFGVRGFIDAYNPENGARIWRLWTIPAKGEPGNETWGDSGSWKTGGAATWITGTYDPDLNLLYWGTGNPGPDYNGDNRPGDNLYSNSVLAIDPDTGKRRWHFQYTPHDLHDWDSNQVPVLVDAEIGGRPRKLLVQANRNAFYYVLDRTNGEFVTAQQFTKQTWASKIDAHGRPVVLPGSEPTIDGALVYPGLEGAVNWSAPSYSPQTKLFYVQAKEDYAQVFYKMKDEYEAGKKYDAGAARNVLGQEPYGALKAIEATTGLVKWEFREQTSSNAACLTTASGLLFSGTREGQFFALDATKGDVLWRFTTGGAIHGGTVTFLVDGKQHIAIASGQALFVFSL